MDKNKNLHCEEDEETSIMVCNSDVVLNENNFETIEFTFRSTGYNHIFAIPSKNYVVLTDNNKTAILKVMHTPYLEYIGLGTTFLSGLYLHLNANYDEVSIGWTLNFI